MSAPAAPAAADRLNILPDRLMIFAEATDRAMGSHDRSPAARSRYRVAPCVARPDRHAVPRLEVSVGQATPDKAPCLYRSIVCFILQGSKEVAIHDDLLHYDFAQYLVSVLDLPPSGRVRDVEDGQPYVAVSLMLEPALLVGVAATMPPTRDADAAAAGIGIAINPMTPPLRDTPADIPVLAPMVERELLYRLLQGPQGHLLRQIARPDGGLGRIRRAVAWIAKRAVKTMSMIAQSDPRFAIMQDGMDMTLASGAPAVMPATSRRTPPRPPRPAPDRPSRTLH